jgi:hypothetical protein
MKKRRVKQIEEEGCIDLVERAVHLLRRTPLASLALFYVGAVPFCMALLFYLADMAASPFAAERCAGGALGLALLYVWMKCWHAVFCSRLYAIAAHRKAGPLKAREIFQLIHFQLTRSTWSLLAIPIAATIMIPFGRVYAYYQNLTIVDCARLPAKEAVALAGDKSKPWPKQNHYMLAILYGFGYLVFINVVTVVGQVPGLLKSLVGIESEFCMSYHWMGNTTFLTAVAVLTYLVVEPFIKSAYVLRYYACESITTGEDIIAELKQVPARRSVAGVVRMGLILLMTLGSVGAVRAEVTENETATVEVEMLDETLDRVMLKREFTWRMPREYAPAEDSETGFFGRFLDRVEHWIKSTFEKIGKAVERFFEWLGDKLTKTENRKPRTNGFDPAFFKGLSVFVGAVLLLVLGILLAKALLDRRRPLPKMEEAQSAAVEVDIEDEELLATMLEEDEWITMARDFAAKGELRKSMRAWFLAGLAALSRMDFLSILKSKSNLDYRRELVRRARRRPDVVPVFSDNIRLFERAWYGLHVTTEEDLEEMEQNLERMRHEA